MAKVRVAPSSLHGRGVMVEQRLRKGEAAFRVTGPLVAADRVTAQGFQVWRDWYVEPSAPGRFLNHACAPTAEVTRALDIRARRHLHPGEELTIDYSTVVLWEPWRMRCACKAPDCRGEVRPWGRLQPRLRDRYPVPLFAWLERGRVPPGLPADLQQGARQWLATRRRISSR